MNPQDSNISRWVAFLILPLATLASGFVAIKAQTWFNYHLDPAEATGYIVSIVTAIAGGIALWMHNRGKYEIAKATGIDDEKIDLIAHAVAERLPKPPQAPAPVSQHHPHAPGG